MTVIDMDIPKSCYECPFFVRSESPKHPFVDCKLIGRLGSIFNFIDGRPIDCPIKCDIEDIKAEIENITPKAHIRYGKTSVDTALMIPIEKVLEIIDKHTQKENESAITY